MDISNRSDIKVLVNSFYDKVKQDETIGFIFNDVIKVDWPLHLPVMYDFWESILLDNPVYQKNTMQVHFNVNRKVKLEAPHFEKWLELFNTTVDSLFEGPVAEKAKTRAKSVAGLMLFKMNQING
jgi:hemoglobin